MNVRRITVRSSAGSYGIVCGTGVLRSASREIYALGEFTSIHVVSSSRIWRAVGQGLLRGLGKALHPQLHLFGDGETSKDIGSVERICRSLVRARADRRALILAVGGGVVGDVAGFAAASYLRGVALVQVPTTLVAQTDSAIGGKTGVNLPEGKNLVGAFYPPRLVLVDPEMLCTLPEREFRGGLAEVIKYGVIADAKLFAFLERDLDRILAREAGPLDRAIARSLEIKAHVVSKDEKESGLREILNFGHTFAHALESVTRYSRYQHGEAVAWGMMAAALLGHEIGLTRAQDVSRIVALVRRLGRLPAWPRVSPAKLMDAMISDKKTRAGKLRFVLSPKIGRAGSYDGISLQAVKRVLHFTPELAARGGALHG
ncbi:MAG TPA: 3-dehydroquinate synthase [Terriglobales bacterium]|nr:3-dehydroquinate synthase [Terriglobales bacterium]